MSAQAPSRLLEVPGTSNFRDLGGYIGHQGKQVRWRTVFRSDHLAGLTPQGLATLQQLGLRRTADFRGAHERSLDGYAWEGVTTHVLSVEPTVVQQAFAMVQQGGQLSVDETVELMQATYRSFVHTYAPQFAQFFELLLQEESPLVFHCTAGKDRTGWAAALLLEALGVPRATIEHDYLLTNQWYQRPTALAARAAAAMPQELLDVLWKVQPSFLHSAYALVEQDFGSMETYLREVMQLDHHRLSSLRARYLTALN